MILRSALFVGGLFLLGACGTTPPALDTDSELAANKPAGGGFGNTDGGGGSGAACTVGATQKCTLGDAPADDPCSWGIQTCEAGGTEVQTTKWGACSVTSIPSDQCKMSCDALPHALGGYKVAFQNDAWTIFADPSGHPVKADGSVDAAHTCSLHAEMIDTSGSKTIAVPAGVQNVFFQLVGAGGGGGRFFSPSSSGGGAGAFVAGTIDVGAAASLIVTVGDGGSVTAPNCSEDACDFKCTCQRGPGTAGGDSTIAFNGATITAGGGGGGTQGATPTAGGKFGVAGTATAVASVHVNSTQSTVGALGGGGCGPGCSGKGASPTCDWGTGASNNQSGSGAGAGGGGGNNSAAGHGTDGVAIVQWVTCTP